MVTMLLFSFILFLTLFDVNSGQTLDIHGQVVNGPLTYGELSDGVVAIAAGGKLVQNCNIKPPYICGAVDGGIMSGLYINNGAQLIQGPESKLISGNYTIVTLDKGCELSLLHQAEMRPNVDFGGGRIEVYCSAVWSLGAGSYINLDRQSKLLVKAPFNLGRGVMVRMEPASTLDIENDLEIKDLVFLILNKGSRFQINPTSGGAATISSSSDFSLTTVTLEGAALLLVNGTFTVGNGRQVTMTIANSGSLIVLDRGQFLVEATTFTIGPSSFWLINGSFTLDKSSTFDSGMQSNLTIDGSIDTSAGSLVIGPFSSFVIQGSCLNGGNITTSEFSRLVIGPTGPGNQGTVQAQSGGGIFLGQWSSVEIMGYAQLSASNIIVGQRGTASIPIKGLIQLSSQASIFLDAGASIEVPGQYKSQGGTMHLGIQADMMINGAISQDLGTSIVMAEGSEAAIASSIVLELQRNGSISLGKGAFLTINGQAEISGGSLNLQQQAGAKLGGQLQLFTKANVSVGAYSDIEIPAGTIVTVTPGQRILIGERSQLVFCPNVFCTLMKDFVVESYQLVNVCSNTPGITCFHSGR